MNRKALALVLIPLLILLIGCGGPDLTVTNIEVTQGIQTATNTIQLVAQRGTAVRATLGVAGATTGIPNVTGLLHAFVGGSEITPAAGLAPINAPFTAPLAPQRATENDTLNFEILSPSGITASSNVTFRVDITPVPGETNTGNNSMTTGNLSFVGRTTPSLFYTNINYTPSGLGLASAALMAPGAGDLFVRGILPVNDGDPNLYRQGLFPSLTFTEDANGDGRLDALGSDGNNLIALLASCRQLIVNLGLGATNNTFLFGWLSGNPIDGNGLAQVGGRNAFGNTDVTRGQRTYAHELTHNFGLNHINQNLDDVGWDVGARLNNNWVGNNVTGRLKPTTLFDVQDAGRLTNQAWVFTGNYNFLLGSAVLASNKLDKSRGGVLASPATQEERATERVAVIQGIFDSSGEKLIRLKPVFRFPWASEPVTRQAGTFLVEITDDSGTVTKQPFSALVADDPDKRPEQEVNGFFEVMVPVNPRREIVSVRILDSQGRREFGAFNRSRPPEIRILSPGAGAQLRDQTEVVWQADDSDTPQNQLLYQVAYSPDGGESWVPVAVDVPGTEKRIVFDSTRIQQSRGNGVIRVFVSDGLNTVFADVSELTTLAAQYPPPQVPAGRLSIAFPVSDTELRLVFSEPLDRESAETTRNYSTAAGLQIEKASLTLADPRQVSLKTVRMDGKSLTVDRVRVKDLRTAAGVTLPERTSPAFLHGIASIEEVRRRHKAEFPYASRFEGVVASMSCGKNGGVWKGVLELGFTFLHEEKGGPYSSIKVVTDLMKKVPNVVEEHHKLQGGQTLHLLWAGGVIREVNGETQLVDTGYMEGSILPALKTPPPYLIKVADIGGDAAKTENAKSLEGVIVRLHNVVVDQVEAPDRRGIRLAVLKDESGARVDAMLLSEVAMPVEKNQSFRSVRAIVVRPRLDALQLLIEWDGAMEK